MTFRLESIELESFRCFSSSVLTFEKNLTMLIADNGHGKSTTLDAIAICLAQLLGPAQSKDVAKRPQIAASDARTIYALPPYRNSEFPVHLAATASIGSEKATTTWRGVLENPNKSPEWDLPPEAKSVASSRTRKKGPDVDLPVFAYYGTNRARADVIHSSSPSGGWFDRGFGYQNALRAGGSLRELGPWLEVGESGRDRKESVWGAALDSVYEAATQVLSSHGVRRVSYNTSERDLVLDFGRLSEDIETGKVEAVDPGSTAIPMRLAADGYRSVLGLVADLAFRCGVLNSHREGEAPQLTSGVVLIDEIDMHLHPTWQTHVLSDLAKAFPLIQFIVTTHSPFVLSSIKGECLRQIESGDSGSVFQSPKRSTEGARIDLLTKALLRAPTRADSDLVDLLEQLTSALQDRDLVTAEELVLQLERRYPRLEDPDANILVSEFRWRQQRADT